MVAASSDNGTFACQVESWSQLRQLLALGVSARAEADTPENSKSSRGHAILTLEVRMQGRSLDAGFEFREETFVLPWIVETTRFSLVKQCIGLQLHCVCLPHKHRP